MAFPPAECLAITFTRRAAGELRDRLRALLPGAWEQVALHTFHSLGLSILREHHNAAGLQRGFRIASEAERIRLLREALDISDKNARRRLALVSRAKRTGAPDDDTSGTLEIYEIYEIYERAMEARNLCDYDDLVVRAADTLAGSPEIRAQYRHRYRWISIDEYQDVDEQQVRLLGQLVPPGGNVCAIGDPDQAVYGFRGADVRFFSQFRHDHPGARVVRLARNYRSDRNIVELSTQVIGQSGSAQRSVAVAEHVPDLVTLHEASTEKAEAEFIVQTLEQVIGGHSFFSLDSGRTMDGGEHAFSFSDFAVLYRTGAQVPALAEALARSGMPFQHRSHRRLLEHPGVTEAIDVLQRRSGSGSVREQLEAACLGDGRGDARLVEACELLRPAAVACGDDLERFVSDVSLGAEVDTWDPRADRISLLTVHAAKGLEFPVVFIVGCERGVLPLTWGRAGREVLDEERRLFYVGITRAMSKLYLCRAKKRRWRGKIRELPPSPFLADIERRLLERHRSQLPARRMQGRGDQMPLFS